MSDLLEHILSEDYVSAGQLFEERLNNIVEKKLIEKKKMMQAEAMGGMSKAEIDRRKKAGYRKAADVLPDPYDMRLGSIGTVNDDKPSKPKIKANRKKKISEGSYEDVSDAELQKRAAQHKDLQKTFKVNRSTNDGLKDGLKKLADKPIKSIVNRQKDMDTRYSDAMSKARELQARGSRGKVRMVMKRYAPYHVGKALGSIVKGLGKGLAANSPLSEENT
jgi:hypothetical protein